MIKKLEIGSCNKADDRLAEIALFERLQAYFNIYPGKMAEVVNDLSAKRGINKIKLAKNFRLWILDEFEHAFNTARASVDPRHIYTGMMWDSRDYVPGPYSSEIQKYFNLSPGKMVRDVSSKCKPEELEVSDVLWSMHYQTPIVIEWAFKNVITIIKKK